MKINEVLLGIASVPLPSEKGLQESQISKNQIAASVFAVFALVGSRERYAGAAAWPSNCYLLQGP
jgi:hypothetical protein